MFNEEDIASEKTIGGGNWKQRFKSDFKKARSDFSAPEVLQQFLDKYHTTIIDGAHRWCSFIPSNQHILSSHLQHTL